MAFLDNLSESQREAVVYNDGPHLIIAGAGSGKTRVLTYKIAYLLSQGVSGGNILALTFTNKAAREMRSRIAQLVGKDHARYLAMGTFHSVFSRILRQEADQLGYTKDYTIYDTADSKNVIKELVKEMNLDEKIYKTGEVLSRISEAKNNLVSTREYAIDRNYQMRDKVTRMYRMADVYYYYQKRLRDANAMDFDDLLCNMYYLLQNFPETKRKYQEIFKYILVDEYQDTNRVQYLIIKHLAELYQHICVVGDDAQSIYAFRGADIRNILEFQQDYEGCPLFKLERNYRSTKNIVGAANSLIKHNLRQISKDVYSENAEGLPIQIYRQGSDRDEGTFLAKKAYELHQLGRDYDDIAVLYRTNAQSRMIEDEFRKMNVPYRIYGGVSFYQRKEVKDVLSYFRLICNPKDDEALLRIINFPARKLGDTTMKKVKAVAHEQGVNLFDVVSNPAAFALDANKPTQERLLQFSNLIKNFQGDLDKMNAYEFATHIVAQTQIRAAFMGDQTQEGLDRLQNVEELMSAIREFQEHQEGVDQVSIRDFLSEVALLTDQDNKNDDETPRVTLMTVHSAKGLEYGVVMIAGMEENLFPSMFSETEKEIEEERRLFYVAITRAKEECYICSADQRYKNGQIQFQQPSRFLRDLDARFIQRMQSSPRRSVDWSSKGFSSFSTDSYTSSPWSNSPIGAVQQGLRPGPAASYDCGPTGSSSRSSSPSGAPRPRKLIPISSRPTGSSSRSYSPKGAVQQGLRPGPTGALPRSNSPSGGPSASSACDLSSFPVGCRVSHDKFGPGTVLEAYRDNGNDKLVVRFDQAGEKTMFIKFAKLTKL